MARAWKLCTVAKIMGFVLDLLAGFKFWLCGLELWNFGQGIESDLSQVPVVYRLSAHSNRHEATHSVSPRSHSKLRMVPIS